MTSRRAGLGRGIEAAREGRSAALLVHGEAVGQDVAARDAAEPAARLCVLRARGIESESHLPFAALSELLAPLLDLRSEIPPVPATALGGALALEAATVTDRFAVAAGVLSLLAAAAERQPVLALADDLQWLDEAWREALVFAARRLDAEGGRAAVRPARRRGAGAGGRARARRAPPRGGSTTRAPAPCWQGRGRAADQQVTDKLVAAAGGNPLALREIPRGAERRAAGRPRPHARAAAARRHARARLPPPRRRAALSPPATPCWWRPAARRCAPT